MSSTPVTDGRTARAARTRAAVVDALLALVEAGNPRPTARAIAERAGISLRSVYVHFHDIEDLFMQAAARQMHRYAGLVERLPTDGPLDARIAAFADQRARLLERIGPVRRASAIHEPFSPTLSEFSASVRAAGRREIERVFATELDALAPDERRRRIAMIDTMSTGPAYDAWRLEHGFDEDEARAVLADAIRSILSAGTGPSEHP